MPQEEWDALPLERRMKLYDLLDALRPSRASMLGTLPIELRREWSSGWGEGRVSRRRNGDAADGWGMPAHATVGLLPDAHDAQAVT
jgi:hypothetical protein